MSLVQNIRNFSARNPFVGSMMWLLTIQFFIAQLVVANSWVKLPYSWRLNAISDLGATGCGLFDDDRFVCSPLHGLMNGSLILLGLTMVIGSVLLYAHLQRSRAGFGLMALAGVGAFLVGVFPEDSIFWAHIVGQDLAFVFGNVALIVFGFTLPSSHVFRWYSIASGTVALVALILFLSHHRFFLGLGGMERTVAYPLLIWLMVAGAYLATRRDLASSQSK
jgi:hypothetical membrane protein